MPETHTPPDDLIDLKARWYAASETSRRIGKEPPAGARERLNLVQPPVHVAAPVEHWLTYMSEDQQQRLAQARAEVMRLVLELADHPWWKTLPPDATGPGRIEVNRLARERYERQALAAA
jgi:hypothetical protein